MCMCVYALFAFLFLNKNINWRTIHLTYFKSLYTLDIIVYIYNVNLTTIINYIYLDRVTNFTLFSQNDEDAQQAKIIEILSYRI